MVDKEINMNKKNENEKNELAFFDLDKKTKKEIFAERVQKWYENKPKILKTNTYFWVVEGVNSKYRSKLENRYFDEVFNWLYDMFPLSRITADTDLNKIYLDNVLVFSIYISNHHFYKKQNLPYIKQQVQKMLEGD